MKNYSLVALDDRALMRGLHACASAERTSTADLIAHIAEVDHRKLYVPEACPSMYDYCVRRMNFSEDAAAKRIQAARTARRFPVIFHMVADGRLHLSAVCLLAPHLTPANSDKLLAAAASQTKSSIEAMLTARSAKSAILTMALEASEDSPTNDLAAAPSTQVVANSGEEHAPGHVDVHMRDSAPRLSAAEVRAHNPYAAEQQYGAGFMQAKREAAAARREAERAARARRLEEERAAKEQARADAQAARERERAEVAGRKQAEAAKRALIEEVVPALLNLGYPLARARAAAATTESILDAPLKDRILLALKGLSPQCRRYGPDGIEKVA